jgi:hypothetical protein
MKRAAERLVEAFVNADTLALVLVAVALILIGGLALAAAIWLMGRYA